MATHSSGRYTSLEYSCKDWYKECNMQMSSKQLLNTTNIKSESAFKLIKDTENKI